MEADQVSCLLRSFKRFAYRITLPYPNPPSSSIILPMDRRRFCQAQPTTWHSEDMVSDMRPRKASPRLVH